MRASIRGIAAVTLAMTVSLGGCAKQEGGGNSVKMQNMEVVDGTASDAMTDLDAARNDATPIPAAEAAGNTSAPAAARPKPAANAAASDAEVVAQD